VANRKLIHGDGWVLDYFRFADVRTPVRVGWKPTPERVGRGDHRMAFAASKAIHRRCILRSIPTTAALEWLSD
jgi:hypothetical protein